MRYPGGKNAAGVPQRLINLIPPHRLYLEPFGGSGAVLRFKKPAPASIVVEIESGVCAQLAGCAPPATTVVCGDGVAFLAGYPWRGDEFVYCDPPYVGSTRRGGQIYRHELSDARHLELLSVLVAVPAAVMLSGYRSALYDRELAHWRRVDFQAMTRRGPATESLWLNYGEPTLLHDDRYLGDGYRERERIRKKRARWVLKLMALPRLERNAIYGDLSRAIRAAAPNPDLFADPRAISGGARGNDAKEATQTHTLECLKVCECASKKPPESQRAITPPGFARAFFEGNP